MGRRRGRHERARLAPPGRARRFGRAALFAMPVIAVALIAILATGVLSTLAQFTASITNTDNNVRTGSLGLSENNGTCVAGPPADGQWHDCGTINKYAAGGQTVTLENTGTVPAQLSLLPSACTDSVEGAAGPLCGQVSVAVSCRIPPTSFPVPVVPQQTLNAFAAGRNFPTGYSIGTLAPGQSASCTFALTGAASIPAGEGLSQPLAWRLR